MQIPTIPPNLAVRSPAPGPGPAPVAPVAAPEPLAPAVRVDIRKDNREGIREDIRARETPPPRPDAAAPTEARVRIDRDTRTVVYQEVDPASGDVVIQLPDPVILKARAYAEQAAAARAPAGRPLDRTA